MNLRNNIEILLHRKVRELYSRHPESMNQRDFDPRDWESIHPDHVPDVRPLFGGEIYHCLGHVYDHIDVTDEISSEILAPEHASAKPSGKERFDWVWRLKAFADCQTRSIAEIARPWEIIIRDTQEAIGDEDEDLSPDLWEGMPRWPDTYRRLSHDNAEEMATLVPALERLFPRTGRVTLRTFAEQFSLMRACQQRFIEQVHELVDDNYAGIDELMRAVRVLLEIQFILLFMAMSLSTINPILRQMEDWAME